MGHINGDVDQLQQKNCHKLDELLKTLGFLKGRCRRLKRLECKLNPVPNIIIACCVLHNITVSDQTEIEMLLSDSECTKGTGSDNIVPPAATVNDVNVAKSKRDGIAQILLP